MKKKIKNTNKKGFTLVELIVVIAIISVLAGILIPMLSGYVKRAKKESDVTAGGTIGKAALSVLTDNEKATNSFYEPTATSYTVNVDGANGNEKYDLVVVCTTDSKYKNWIPSGQNTQDFCDALEDSGYIGEISKLKYPSSKRPDTWIIGYRKNDVNTIEVWAGEKGSGGTCKPEYRIWPEPDKEYA